MISTYSVCSSVVFCNLFLALAFLLQRRTRFLAGHSVSFILLVFALGLVRLFMPVDLEHAIVIQS